ncbi:HD domain-containing protein [Limosilactobacillus sp. STM2_1]|uniref:HD domain-containing protein n=1 Tax=Limosilactobacillus rudii TaxID=2759755 RepID=A0A7W3YNA6_9LACO|nr:HD domain-containing protein [Limosilactobacillus rudii]MBB1079005.1 HD domain-containing protein [Limosilactobacillus rudii]MBB1098309.1 HD domain-containing protein [Limosilactobacillus rudii]MCD7135317.1 HD domain-containing protein [Limosilactobacillus rudii]
MNHFYDEKLHREKVFRDPIHGQIIVDNQIIMDLINTPEFQRLRRIKQLGTSSFTFHGAEHSRFGHCLGVYEITRQMCNYFQRNYPSQQKNDGLWDDKERPVALCAALLHDLGHGPYSHTFEHIFHTNHEQITRQLITDSSTNINKILRRVSPDFPHQVASVIDHTYSNPQVVQMISSQVDADRMDYLQRDAYYTGTNYGKFDLDRVLHVMRPVESGIAFEISGMHAVEDYIISRLQMYLQVYFHPVSRSMEVILDHLLMRAKYIYQHPNDFEPDFTPHMLMPFFNNHFSLDDYLALDDGVLTTYFIHWTHSRDDILSDLASRFLNRRPFKSVVYDKDTQNLLPALRNLIQTAGFNSQYYTAVNDSFKLPYDTYHPQDSNAQTQIELLQPNGDFIELSQVSTLVASVSGREAGDQRFFFPKEMLESRDSIEIFEPIYEEFQRYIKNNHIIKPKE